nr:SMYamide [Schistocerca gregaria]
MKRCSFSCMLVWAIVLQICLTEGIGFKKLPFNGAMYGKRTSSVDYDSSNRAISSLCETASELCSSWYSQPDSN